MGNEGLFGLAKNFKYIPNLHILGLRTNIYIYIYIIESNVISDIDIFTEYLKYIPKLEILSLCRKYILIYRVQ